MEDLLRKYLFQPRKVEEILPTAKVVIDTNFLLSGYQYRGLTFKEIIETLTRLNEQERLIIPSHVLKEFFKRRPEKIVELIQSVQQHRDKIQTPSTVDKIEKVIPNLEFTSFHREISDMEDLLKSKLDEIVQSIKEYRELHSKLIEEFKSYFNEDPILKSYSELFISAYFRPEEMSSEDELIKEFKDVRVKDKVPPGYQDGNKGNGNEAGDYIIWAHILEIKDDIIFVTGDNKPDWVYSEPGSKKVISARRELVEEFYNKSGGKTFSVVNPATFVEIFNPDVEQTVIEDLSNQNLKNNDQERNYIEEAIMSLNNEGNSLAANSKYGALMERLQRVKPSQYYQRGTNNYLDSIFAQISYNKPFLDEVIRKANKIAVNDSLSDKEKSSAYDSLAEWALMNQND